MKIPWRIVFLVAAIGLGVLAWAVMRDGLRTSSLRDAVAAGDASAARGLLERQPSLITIAADPEGRRAIHGTAFDGRLLIHAALMTRSVEMIETLAAFGADLGARLDGDTLLHLAAATGDVPMMTWLLDRGADVNARNGCEHPASAVCASGELAGVPFFQRPEASRAICPGCDHEGRAPLHAVGRISAGEASTLLLSRGADVHAIDRAGRTALHAAAHAGASDSARVLCAFGADPARRDRNGRTPEEIARAEDLAHPDDRFTQTGPGELAGWLRAGGGCGAIAARARPGAPVPIEDVNAAWRAHVCSRDPARCGR